MSDELNAHCGTMAARPRPRRVALEEPVDGVWASDHCGVVADLTIPAVACWCGMPPGYL